MALKTEPLRVARSGNTIDGRKIEPEMLLQAAKTYDRETYTAVIWPDHQRYYNMGVVDSITAQKNKDGGVDLYAVLEPNDFYRSNIAYGQRLFTSVELMPDFAKTGEWYLSGLAATDSPASLGTEEVKFSKLPDTKNLYSTFIEAEADTSEDQAPTWFKRFIHTFSKQQSAEDDMASKEYQELKAQFDKQGEEFTALKTKLETFTVSGGDKSDDAAKVVELTQENAALKTQVTELTQQVNEFSEKFTTLETNTKAIGDKLAEAMKEKPGTQADHHSDGGKDLSVFA